MLNLQLTETQISKIGCPQIINIAEQLPVNKNYTWSQLSGTRDINNLWTIVLHHDAYPKKNTLKYTDLQMANEIANDHIKTTRNEPKGDPGIPYHVFIRNGQAYQTNNILDKTYGVSSTNENTVHVVVSGDYVNFDVLTDPDRLALYGSIIALIGVLPNYKDIKAHKELKPTSCPGYDYNKVRDDVSKLILSIKVAESPEQTLSNLFKNVNQHIYLYNQYKADPLGQKWLEPYLTKLHQITVDMNMYFDKK